MRRTYESRYFYMLNLLQEIKANHDISWIQPNGGMSIWVNLQQNSKFVAEKAKLKGVLFQNESALDYSKKDGTHLRIGFAGVNENEIKDGLNILAEIL